MIEVVIRNPATGVELARIEIRNEGARFSEHADYSVKFAVERGSAVGLHTRGIFRFPRRRYNVLALLRQVLETLNEQELELERGYDVDGASDRSSDLAREIRRARKDV